MQQNIAVIRTDLIRANAEYFSSLASHAKLCTVVKADAYGHGAAAAPLPENEQHGQRGRETGRRKVHCRFEHEIFAGHARQQQHDSGDAPAAADDHAHPCAECERSLRRAGQHDELRESGADQHSGERREAGGPAAAGQREIEHEQRNAAAPTENAVRKSCGDAAEAVLRFLLHVPHSLCKKRPRRFFAYFLRKLWQSVH